MIFPLKLHFLRTAGEIITRGTFLEILEYNMFVSEILRVTPTINTNGSELKFGVTTPNQISSNIMAF